MGVTDWHLKIKTPEETSELAEIQIDQAKVQVASSFVQMGFGARWDAENREFTYWGEVKPMAEQQAEQAQMAAGPVAENQGGMLPPTPSTGQSQAPAPPGMNDTQSTEESGDNESEAN